MFLREDYGIMIDSNLRMAKQYQTLAELGLEEAATCVGEHKSDTITWRESYFKKAESHRKEAEYWKGVLDGVSTSLGQGKEV